ncbi:MAG: hypothetical protein ACRDZ7_15840 [Acidimicrobiia bacterium]
MLTDEDRARLLAGLRADLIPRVCRLSGLPVVAVRRLPLCPDQPRSAEAYFVRVEGRSQAVLIPVDPAKWRAVPAVLAAAGRDDDRPAFGKKAVLRLLRALNEAARQVPVAPSA